MAGEPVTTWPEVTSFVDGDSVNAEVLNTPLQQLAARTEYLLRLLGQVDRNKVSVANAEFTADAGGPMPGRGQVVYRTDEGAYALARGDAGNGEWFYAARNAMAVGVVGDVSGSTGTVVLCGFVSFGGGIPAGDVIADANPASGRYYLSNVVAGKLTAGPSGPVIYVCDCHVENGMVTSMIVNPQYRDTGESHVHRSFALDWKPQGWYDEAVDGKYRVYGILPDDAVSESGEADASGVLRLHVCGAWDTDSQVTYRFELVSNTPGSGSWDQYSMTCRVDGVVIWTQSLSGLSGSQRVGPFDVGDNKMKVYLERAVGLTPDTAAGGGSTWTVTMPDAGRGWLPSPDNDGFILDLGMYPAMSRFVPLLPSNSGALVVGGVELRGDEFGSASRWRIYPAVADDDADAALPKGGPWLKWIGNDVVGDGASATTPWDHDSSGRPSVRYIVLHVGRMRVGPTGFVTSLQPAPGSPIKITSALTDANAVQGALQVGLDVDFTSSEGDAPGFRVVKRINGTTFVTGPVVERIVAGPGLSVNREQGTVRISASNAVYAGDFETIALRNAKQDLAGGVFPYTKLLGWGTGTNIDSGFTAKFRVPDHIPYNAGRGYYVVVSASMFGEADGTGDATASFTLTNYTLADQACSPDADGAFDGSVAAPVMGAEATVGVLLSGPYAAFDPVLVHGFRGSDGVAGPGQLVLPDTAQRKSVGALWLKSGAAGNPPVVVYPGYFVGLAIQRCATAGTAYTAPIGFMSLRWNLVEVPAS